MNDEQIKGLAKAHFFNGMPILTCAVEFARALLAASASAEPIYQSKTTTGWMDVSEDHYDLVLEQCRRIVYAAPRPIEAPAQAVALSVENRPAQDDVRDAQRYRWLRQQRFEFNHSRITPVRPDKLDSMIDAAIASQSAKEPR